MNSDPKRPGSISTFLHVILPISLLLAVSACDSGADRPFHVSATFGDAVELKDQRSFAQAEAAFIQLKTQLREQNDLRQLAAAEAELAGMYTMQGRFRNAIEEARNSVETSKEAKDYRGEASNTRVLGDVYAAMQKNAESLEHYRYSYSLSSAFDDKRAMGLLKIKIGRVYEDAGDWKDARTSFEEALIHLESVGDPSLVAEALIGLGQSHVSEGQFAVARNVFARATTAVQASDDALLVARLRLEAGWAELYLGDKRASLEEFREGVNLLRAERRGPELETVMLFSLGEVYYESGRWSEAEQFYREGQERARAAGDRLAEYYLSLFLLRSMERHLSVGNDQREVNELLRQYETVAQRLSAIGNSTGEMYARMQVGKTYERMGRLREAREAYLKALETWREGVSEFFRPNLHGLYLRRLGIDEEIVRWPPRIAALLVRLNLVEEAVLSLEWARQRTFFMQLRNADVTIRNAGLKKELAGVRTDLIRLEVLEKERSAILSQARAQVSARYVGLLRDDIDAVRQRLQSAATRLTSTDPNSSAFFPPQDMSIANLRAKIPVGTTVLQYIPHEDHLIILVLSRAKLEAVTVQIAQDQLQSLLTEYTTLMHDPNVYAGAGGEASMPPMLRFAILSPQLYDLFLRPVESSFDRSVIIIPDWPFINFPFHALERQEKDGNIQYLIERTNVDYLSSLNDLTFQTVSASRVRSVSAMGDPTGKDWSIDYELRDVRSFFRDADVYTGLEATWGNLTALRGQVLQLSTEFRSDMFGMPYGSVAFSDGETVGQSIVLPFARLSELPVYPVMILSNHYGEGRGLDPAHAYFLRMNGVADVFLNAWSADRKAAKFFSEYLYTHLANGLAPGDAYRQALLGIIKMREIQHPHAWGQFFHFGLG